MYRLDLKDIPEKRVYPLSEKFSGRDPAGREIGFTNYYMTVDGKPFFGVSGEMHFCRVSPDQWEDAIVKMQCGGINMLSTYVFWNVHEEEEGVFRFDGCRNLRAFLEVCEKHHMWVIMRIGPFDHGEMRNGGLPDWLFGKPYDVREDNPGFLEATRRLFRALHGQMDGHYFSQGGCIVGTQIENEYQHSCAPWEMTTGVSNEWLTSGHSGLPYMLRIKQIMQEEGIVTPFYTTTAWGGAVTPVEEALPLWGGYSYQPWLFYNKPGVHPATLEYIYRDNHNSAVTKEYNFEPSYDPETRPYACCEMMGGMMCSYKYRFQMDMRAIDALANTKLGSGCNLLGYYMYKGGTNPIGLRTSYLNEGQIPKRSYDYQAAIGEFGQLRESYGRLRAIHMFCQLFSGFFEQTKAVLPEHLKGLQPDDLEPLRFSVRVKGSSGFLFVNNFQDHAEMRDRHGDEVRLALPDGEITFRFDIAAGENAILPFNMDLGNAKLNWATAQPLAHVGKTWFFLAPEGMQSVYCVDGKEIKATVGKAFAVGDQIIMTLSRKDSLGFWVYDDAAYLCDKPLLWDGKQLIVEIADGSAALRAWSEAQRDFVFVQRVEHPCQPVFLPWQTVGMGRYTVAVPADALTGHKQALLRVRYHGDIGHAFAGNELISDNFCNGDAWDIRLDTSAETLEKSPLVLYLTPIKKNVTVDTSAMAGLQEKADMEAAELLSAELIIVDDYPVQE
ncbi:MAG: beta-galactosidase [Clostridia bacterium]|nr:beta-galactosidase [Clostridia bacterium]